MMRRTYRVDRHARSVGFRFGIAPYKRKAPRFEWPSFWWTLLVWTVASVAMCVILAARMA